LEEEEEKRRKGEAEEALRRSKETAVQSRVEMTPQNLHDILNGVNEARTEDMDCSEGENAGSQEEERSPLKKRTGSRKAPSRRHRTTNVTPSEDTLLTKSTMTAASRSASFLDAFVYPYPHTVLELAITLKSNKAFKEFTKALI
jgi:hypothetical protein